MAYKFLIVDDTSFMRKMAADSLRKFGYEVAGEASNGKEAVKLYEELRPDVVLMDLTMPEMTGSEAIKAILKINPEAVVLICSGSNQKEAILEAMEAGAKGYLLKPFNDSRLQEIIRKYAEPFLTPPGGAQEQLQVGQQQGEQQTEMQAAPEKADGSAAARAGKRAEEQEAALKKRDAAAEAPEAAVSAAKASAESAAASAAAHPLAPRTASLDRGRDSGGRLKSFTSSIMCQWQEEQGGETVDYYAVCTESENKLLIERRDAGEDKQTLLPLTIDGFRELAGWLESQLGSRP
ncbi:response regulator [Cohnella lubricantis]|uniref:Response regulator n=1 Tax=Cohnella lubricantis TaxID=2163172 RepID=A0A841TLV2_9BACL|nr:response regulator [Cohnella lubricantis]MBB6679521.1 response regulator [Cohnella lubricantis]MBP2119259.1 YesN/AraC family two-component response regulator [Cohnella lubricantis]